MPPTNTDARAGESRRCRPGPGRGIAGGDEAVEFDAVGDQQRASNVARLARRKIVVAVDDQVGARA